METDDEHLRAVSGFCYLEPKRHIPYITELDGTEAGEFGTILARATKAIKNATRAKIVSLHLWRSHTSSSRSLGSQR